MEHENIKSAPHADIAGNGLTYSGQKDANLNRVLTDLETLIDSTNDLLWSLNPELKLIAANRAFKQTFKTFTGMIPGPGDSLLTEGFFSEDYLVFWKGVYHRALGGEIFTQEIFIPASVTIAEHWLEISFNPIYEGDTITGIVCHSRNITERKSIAEQTIKSEAHLAEAQRLGKLGSWIFDFKTDIATCSEELYHVFGVDKHTFTFTHNSYLQLIEEDDRALVVRSGRHTLNTGESYTIEYRITTPDSEKRIVREHGYGQADTHGKVVRLFGTVQDITDQKNAEDRLKQSELNYLSLFEQASNTILIANKSLDFINVNPSACLSLGYTKEEFMRLSLTDLLFKDDIRLNPLKVDEVNAGETIVRERKLRRKDGTAVVMEVSTKMLEDGRYLMFGHDISDRKRAEMAVIESEARYRAFFENTIDGFILSMTDGALIEVNPAACAIFQMTEEEIGRAGKFGIFDTTDVRVAPLMQQRQATGRAKGELTGIRKDGSRFPLEITSVVFTDAYGLERTSMIVRDITEQLLSRKKIEESEKKYRQIVETAQEGIWLMDAGNQITFVNKKMCEILGYTEQEILGRTNISFKSEAEQARALKYSERRKKGIQESHETTFVTKSGKNIHTQVAATPILDDSGSYMGTLAMITDITERKRTEQEMLWLVNNTEESYILINPDLKIVSFNHQFRTLYASYLGINVFIGDSILDYATPKRRDTLKKTYMRVLQGHNESAEIAVPLRDDSVKYFTVKYKPARDDQGVIIGAFVSVIDITEKKKSEQERAVSEKRFRAIVEHGADAIVILSPEGKPNYISPSIQRVLGFSESEAMELDLFSRLHPDDLAETAAVMGQALANPGVTIAGHTGRLLHKDGTWRWLESAVTNMLHDPSINGIVDNFRDITEKKELENLLNKANSLARIGSWEVDLIKNTLYWSDITKEIHGVPADYIPNLLTAINFYKEGECRDTITQKVQDAIEKGISFDVELQIIDGYGHDKWVRSLGEAESLNGKCVRLGGSFQDITERKKAETDLKNSEQEYKILFASSPLPKWIYDLETFHIQDVNDAAIQHYGYSREEFLKLSIMDIRPDEELPILRDLHQRFKIREGAIYFGVFTHQKKDKTKIQVEISGNQFTYYNRDCMMVISNDVTERELALKRLKDNEAKLLNAQKIARLGYWELNVNTYANYWSDELYDIWGVTKESYVPGFQSFIDTIHPEDRRMFMEKYTAAFNGSSEFDIEHRIVLPDGSVKWIHEKASLVNDEYGKPFAFRGTSQDIDARKRSEIRVHELNEDLRKQAKALAVSNSDLEQFAYVASHDLQEPLRMVTSFLAQLEKKYSPIIDDKGRKYIDFAIDGAKRMRLIILDLLEFSRIGRTADSREDLDLNKLVAEIQILYRKQMEESDAIIEVGPLPVVSAYKSPLRQIFQNLISNALKYKKRNTPVRIRITATEEATHWQFAVADNGIGIEEEYFEKIFIIFQRLHNKDEFSGTGMGLAITKKMVENGGGKIRVTSEAGVGSTFYFTLLKELN